MDRYPKKPRKRVANFSPEEKALLAHLIKQRPIIESKLTDGKTVAKKQAAWRSVTHEFNCNANVHKREIITLKRAWDNMKALSRKSRAIAGKNTCKTGEEPHKHPAATQPESVIIKVEATPETNSRTENSFEDEGWKDYTNSSVFADTLDVIEPTKEMNNDNDIVTEVQDNLENSRNESPPVEVSGRSSDYLSKKFPLDFKAANLQRRPTDYVRREAVMRIKHFEHKRKVEMDILNTQLDIEQIKKRAALFEEERSKILLEKARIELGEARKLINLQ